MPIWKDNKWKPKYEEYFNNIWHQEDLTNLLVRHNSSFCWSITPIRLRYYKQIREQNEALTQKINKHLKTKFCKPWRIQILTKQLCIFKNSFTHKVLYTVQKYVKPCKHQYNAFWRNTWKKGNLTGCVTEINMVVPCWEGRLELQKKINLRRTSPQGSSHTAPMIQAD